MKGKYLIIGLLQKAEKRLTVAKWDAYTDLPNQWGSQTMIGHVLCIQLIFRDSSFFENG